VVEDAIQTITKTRTLREFFERVGLGEELARTARRKVRAGKGKRRGRRYRVKIGPLIVITRDEGVWRAARNLPGVDVLQVGDVCTECLAPGGHPGRLVVWSASAFDKLAKLFPT
jgi:large subunit ribosomal protein L4e